MLDLDPETGLELIFKEGGSEINLGEGLFLIEFGEEGFEKELKDGRLDIVDTACFGLRLSSS